MTVPIKHGSARSHARLRMAALLAGVSLSAVAAHATDGTWLAAPASNNWNTGTNWTSSPLVPDNTASFGASTTTSITFFAATTNINTIQFNADAPAYSFDLNNRSLNINGNGVVNNSLQTPTFSAFGSTITFANQSTAGNATITNTFSFIFFNDQSSAGSANISNAGSITFANSSTAANANIVTESGFFLLSFADTSTAGNATITTQAGSKTQFTGNATGGNARFVASGIVDFSGTSGPAGNAQVSAGSIEGSGSYFLGSNRLTVGGNNLSTEVSGVISDCGPTGTECNGVPATGGSVAKVGSGTLILSGTNTYTGTTDVNAGTLIVNGSIAPSSLTTVNNGGALAGTGTVGATQINSGGIFAPGAGVAGTSMTVAGNLVFQSGAFYLVQVNPSTASFATITGATSLAGTVQAVLAPGNYTPRSYDILHATGGLGGTTFNGAMTFPPNFNATLSYTATDVLLNITGVALGKGAGLNQNQQSAANAISAFANNGGTLPPGFANLLFLTGGNLAAALTLLSGEAATGAQQGAFQLVSEFLSLMLDPLVDGGAGVGGVYGRARPFAPEREALPQDVALAYAKILRAPVYKATPFEQRWSVWGGAFGGHNKTSGDPIVAGSHDLSARTAGVAAGMDYRVAAGTTVGFALAGAGTGGSLAQGLGGGGSDAFQAGIYGTTRAGPFYLAAALAYTQHWMSTDRYAVASDRLYASFNAESVGGRVEAGYRIPNTVAAITPYAAVQAQNFHTPSYSETDVSGGGFGLAYNARNATDTRSELGARFDRQMLINYGAVLALRGKLAWAHDRISDPKLMPTFQALPGASFVVQGAVPAKNAALTSAAAELRLINGVSLLGKLDGEFANGSQTYAGTGTVRWTW